jgi:hypothetical protein
VHVKAKSLHRTVNSGSFHSWGDRFEILGFAWTADRLSAVRAYSSRRCCRASLILGAAAIGVLFLCLFVDARAQSLGGILRYARSLIFVLAVNGLQRHQAR